MSGSAPRFRFYSAGLTHGGNVRKLNEDSFLDDVEAGIWVVADGVGGHQAGDYASSLITRSLGEIGRQESGPRALATLREKLRSVNDNLRAFAANEGVSIVASTVVALLCFGEHFAVIWAGDSRAYRLRHQNFQRLSHDHSEVQELIDAGVLTEAQAETHPRRNVVTRAVGASAKLDLEIVQGRIEPGDLFLLCSDGLTKVASDAEIAQSLMRSSLETAPQRLIDKALARGGPDNITAVVVECRES